MTKLERGRFSRQPTPAKALKASGSKKGSAPKNLSRLRHRSGPFNIVVIAISTALIATVAIPAYASTRVAQDANATAAAQQLAYVKSNTQEMTVTPTVAVAAVARDSYTTTAPAPVIVRAAVGGGGIPISYNGKSVASASTRPTAVNPGQPSFSLAGIFADGLNYVGTPYVYGGSTPAGFDCSGFVLYLYAKVGIHLEHNARIQGESGTIISEADAVPGDLVIFYGGAHDGIYAGNGQVLDAPKPGGAVNVRNIWTSDVFFVRLGI